MWDGPYNPNLDRVLGIVLIIIGGLIPSVNFSVLSIPLIFSSILFFGGGIVLEFRANELSRERHFYDMGQISPNANL